ncbi:MAG: hypothetical protein M1833_000419 [Piccolia ochrophora]|nr:MAG: hypothetical protein M1833_000419 [Piccolia ochrophora]
MPFYTHQILICSGKRDWTSNIQDDDHGEFVKLLRSFLRSTDRSNIPATTMITASSFGTTLTSEAKQRKHGEPTVSVYLLPKFKYIPYLSMTRTAIRSLVHEYLQEPNYHKESTLKHTSQDFEGRSRLPPSTDVNEFFVLICGHNTRDERCGVMGPLLQEEFTRALGRLDIPVTPEGESPTDTVNNSVNQGERLEARNASQAGSESVPGTTSWRARVGLVSHVGGHKYAGNVIIYIPPGYHSVMGGSHPLAGKGLWYGRVAPKHVEGIIEETVLRGRVISELFRGGVDDHGKMLRI